MDSTIETLRNEVKKYIDSADDWLNTLPENLKDDLEESIRQADSGLTLSHKEVSEKYPELLLK